jgi:hypothetical protein
METRPCIATSPTRIYTIVQEEGEGTRIFHTAIPTSSAQFWAVGQDMDDEQEIANVFAIPNFWQSSGWLEQSLLEINRGNPLFSLDLAGMCCLLTFAPFFPFEDHLCSGQLLLCFNFNSFPPSNVPALTWDRYAAYSGNGQ